MAYADFTAYKNQYKSLHSVVDYHHDAASCNYLWMSQFSIASGRVFPTPVGGSNIVTAPTTAAACSSTTTGAMVRPIGGSGDQVLVASFLQPTYNDNAAMLIDRLSHQGGLSGTVTTSQTTNLPTAALTRYTSGVGVYAALEFYTSVGATDAVWTVVYTNQAGTGSRSVSFLLSNTPGVSSFIMVPLQGADTGVKSVESVSLTPSTGTAGNFGVTLFKPLAFIPAIATRMGRVNDAFDMPGWNEPILDNACLQFLFKYGSNQVDYQSQLYFGES